MSKSTSVLQPHQKIFGNKSQWTVCRYCKAAVRTDVKYCATTQTHLLASLLCALGCWLCFWIPYCMRSVNIARHYCPLCLHHLGTHVPRMSVAAVAAAKCHHDQCIRRHHKQQQHRHRKSHVKKHTSNSLPPQPLIIKQEKVPDVKDLKFSPPGGTLDLDENTIRFQRTKNEEQKVIDDIMSFDKNKTKMISPISSPGLKDTSTMTFRKSTLPASNYKSPISKQSFHTVKSDLSMTPTTSTYEQNDTTMPESRKSVTIPTRFSIKPSTQTNESISNEDVNVKFSISTTRSYNNNLDGSSVKPDSKQSMATSKRFSVIQPDENEFDKEIKPEEFPPRQEPLPESKNNELLREISKFSIEKTPSTNIYENMVLDQIISKHPTDPNWVLNVPYMSVSKNESHVQTSQTLIADLLKKQLNITKKSIDKLNSDDSKDSETAKSVLDTERKRERKSNHTIKCYEFKLKKTSSGHKTGSEQNKHPNTEEKFDKLKRLQSKQSFEKIVRESSAHKKIDHIKNKLFGMVKTSKKTDRLESEDRIDKQRIEKKPIKENNSEKEMQNIVLQEIAKKKKQSKLQTTQSKSKHTQKHITKSGSNISLSSINSILAEHKKSKGRINKNSHINIATAKKHQEIKISQPTDSKHKWRYETDVESKEEILKSFESMETNKSASLYKRKKKHSANSSTSTGLVGSVKLKRNVLKNVNDLNSTMGMIMENLKNNHGNLYQVNSKTIIIMPRRICSTASRVTQSDSREVPSTASRASRKSKCIDRPATQSSIHTINGEENASTSQIINQSLLKLESQVDVDTTENTTANTFQVNNLCVNNVQMKMLDFGTSLKLKQYADKSNYNIFSSSEWSGRVDEGAALSHQPHAEFFARPAMQQRIDTNSVETQTDITTIKSTCEHSAQTCDSDIRHQSSKTESINLCETKTAVQHVSNTSSDVEEDKTTTSRDDQTPKKRKLVYPQRNINVYAMKEIRMAFRHSKPSLLDDTSSVSSSVVSPGSSRLNVKKTVGSRLMPPGAIKAVYVKRRMHEMKINQTDRWRTLAVQTDANSCTSTDSVEVVQLRTISTQTPYIMSASAMQMYVQLSEAV